MNTAAPRDSPALPAGAVGALDRTMRVLKVSEGELLLDSSIGLAHGSVERCIFTIDGGDEIRLHARASFTFS